MILRSYAKLNLYLKVLNKRRDNYHNISTLFERVSLCDRIILKSRPDSKIHISCRNPYVPQDSSNLCYRAALLLQKSFNLKEGVDITIKKRIPAGAGLGGGSSNAASALLGLNKLWRLGLSRKKLVNLAKKIGCDVPFFIYDTSFAKAEERGDKIKPLLSAKKQMQLWHIIVVPKIRVSTPLVYKKWDAYNSRRNRRAGLTKAKDFVKILYLALRKNGLSLMGGLLFNSLERITFKLYPQARQIKDRLAGLGLKTILMSGSGPAVFGIVSSRKEAISLGRKLKRKGSSWQVFITRTI